MSDRQSSRPELPVKVTERPRCPRCQARMTVQRVVPARSGFEHWTQRCTKCGNIREAQVEVDPIKYARGWLDSELAPPK